MSGFVISGLVMSGLVMSGLVLSGLIAVALCNPPFCGPITLPPIWLICAMPMLILGYFCVDVTKSERETVLRGMAITSTKLTHWNELGGIVWKNEPVVPEGSVLQRLFGSGGVSGLTVNR